MKVGVKGVLNLLFLFCLASSSSPSPLVRYGSRDHDLGEVLEDGGGDGNQLQINFQTDPRLPQTASSPSSLGSEYPDGFEIRIPHRGHDHKEDLIINSTTGKITPVPPSELTELKSLAHYSPPAFCREDILLNRTCGNACNSNELKELTDLEPFGDYDHGLFGYTAISHQKALIIIAFRGTRNFNNWVNNLLFAKADKHPFQSAPDDARVHYGFLKDYRLIKDDVYKRLIPLAQIYPDYDVLIIGHSLGGALSVICAMDLIDQFPDVIVRRNERRRRKCNQYHLIPLILATTAHTASHTRPATGR